jgi:TonB family protein
MFALPVLTHVTPPISKASPSLPRFAVAMAPSGASRADRAQAQQFSTDPLAGPESHKTNWTAFVPAIYLAPVIALFARLLIGLHGLRRMARRSEPIYDPTIRKLVQEMWLQSEAFLRPRVMLSRDVVAPVTFNTDEVWILLPESWPEWSEGKLRAVLLHEMTHVRRDDSANLLLAALATCVFWFNPLAWFLKRQLAALAEEACDEAVVARETSPQTYANYLIDFASDVRLAAHSMAFVRRSSLQRRIERIFRNTPGTERGRKLLTGAALALFFPALYLTAAMRFDEPPNSKKDWTLWPKYAQVFALSPAAVAALEASLNDNPEDLQARMELTVYYAYHKNNEEMYTKHVVWFARHHPEIGSLSMTATNYAWITQSNEESKRQIEAAWEEALARHNDSPTVISNAAAFIVHTDPSRALQLLKKAEALDSAHPEMYRSRIVAIYVTAEMKTMHPDGKFNGIDMQPETALGLRDRLETSNDAALLAETGKAIVEFGIQLHAEAQSKHGLELIQEAIQLDPNNPAWKEALEWAQTEPQRLANYEKVARAGAPQPGVVRIGSKVAEASLVTKIDPVYPPLAKEARIQGNVEFSIRVGTDGKVESLSLVRGHPLLVNAAKDAVSKWVYHSATVDGKPIPFETEVIVPFHLN